jgi:hypothetical protein
MLHKWSSLVESSRCKTGQYKLSLSHVVVIRLCWVGLSPSPQRRTVFKTPPSPLTSSSASPAPSSPQLEAPWRTSSDITSAQPRRYVRVPRRLLRLLLTSSEASRAPRPRRAGRARAARGDAGRTHSRARAPGVCAISKTPGPAVGAWGVGIARRNFRPPRASANQTKGGHSR